MAAEIAPLLNRHWQGSMRDRYVDRNPRPGFEARIQRASPEPRHAPDLGSRLRSPGCARPGTGFIIAIGGFACDRTADGTNAAQGDLVD